MGGHAMARLSLCLLGTFRVDLAGEPVTAFGYDKVRALLAYLAVEADRPHRREALAGLLWPEQPERNARQNLSQALFKLRGAIGDHEAKPPFLIITPQTLQFNPSSAYELDVGTFTALLDACQAHEHELLELCNVCRDQLGEAVALYRGEFMAGFSLGDSSAFEEWSLLYRERLGRLNLEALHHLAGCYEAQGEYEQALEYAWRRVELDAWQEEAHQAVMRLLALNGQRESALAQYQTCRRVLAEDLGVEPAGETTRLYEQIVAWERDRGAEAPGGRGGIFPAGPPRLDTPAPATPPPFLSSPPPPPSSPAPLVAREHELARLDYLLEGALAEQGRVVFVTGGAGRGKTALIQEFTQRAQTAHPDLIVAWGHSNAHTGPGDPYLPFRQILELLTGDVESSYAAGTICQEHATRLWNLMPRSIQALLDAGPDLVETFLPGPPLVERASAFAPVGANWLTGLEELVERKLAIPSDSNLQQSALFEQYTRVLKTLAEQQPLLLALDDLQWSDLGSTGLLFHLGRRLEKGRILLVGAYRPAEVAVGRRSISSGAQERHPLEPVVNEFRRYFGDIEIDLSQAENRQFIDAWLDTEPNRLDDTFRETLYRQTGGHPLFTVELLRGMQERRDLVQEETGRWVEGQALDWETLPTRVEAAIAERIGRLPEHLRNALTVASVEGETFTAEVIAQVEASSEREMVRWLSQSLERGHRLVGAQGIRQVDGKRLSQYRFRHILFQRYLYHSLNAAERAYLHEAVGSALEELYGERTGEIAVHLARHFQEAGITEKAVDYLHQAGKRAVRLSAHQEAIAHFNRGLRLLEGLAETPERIQQELDLQIALGVPLVMSKGHAAPEVEETYARARELYEHAYAGDAHQHFQVVLGLRRFYLLRGQVGTAHELGEQLLTFAQSVGDATYLSRAHSMQGEVLLHLGAFSQTRERCEQGMAWYDPQQRRSHILLFGNDTETGLRISEALAWWYLGYPDRALKRSQEMVALAQESSHPFSLVIGLHFSSVVHQLRRDAQVVRERTEAVLRISAEHGFTLFMGWGSVLSGWALSERGEIEDGITQMQQGLTAWRDMGAELSLPEFLAALAQAYGRAGQAEEGLRLIAEALALVDKNGERCWEAELYRLKGELLLRQVEAEAGVEAEAEPYHRSAERCFERALEIARRQNAKSWELRAAMSLCRLQRQHGATARHKAAWGTLAEIYGWFSEGFETADLRDAKALLEEAS